MPPELVHRVLEAATQAPSGGNSQPWRFIVVQDPEMKRRLGDLIAVGYREGYGGTAGKGRQADPASLVFHMAEVPVLVVVCAMPFTIPGDPSNMLGLPSWVYPAIQNLLLAARAVGLGSIITNNHRFRVSEIKSLLGIPDDVEIFAIIPLGYPAQRHGRKTRKPVEEVTFSDRWANPASFEPS